MFRKGKNKQEREREKKKLSKYFLNLVVESR